MQKLLKWFALLLAFAVSVFLVFFLISINSSVVVDGGKELTLESPVDDLKQEKLWLEHFSTTQREGHSFPVNEVFIKLDLDEKITKTITYKLSAQLLDPYQLFCLKEELKRHKMKYYLQKDTSGMELLIYSRNVNKLNNLVQVLKNYKIQASIKPYKEEY